jgi:hypothetical protein
MLNSHSTTIHGSTLIGVSRTFCCKQCSAPVAHVVLPGGDVAYECASARCGKTVMLGCVEALAIRDKLTVELPQLLPISLVPSFA